MPDLTFTHWWDTTKATAMPDTYRGWEESCRQAFEAGRIAERKCGRAAQDDAYVCGRNDERERCANYCDGEGLYKTAHALRMGKPRKS